ncbi:MAG TPA: VWA domain-containing protein [Gemmataceae bacterium]|nr:VWA domain-containing protein [Gemmataceae bacterium]
MTFIHGYLLAGLLLVGVPVLLHLIMRQKPRHLQFPAFRFLRQRHLINRRKLRLQHLLLLLLRMGVIAALCLALARPRVAAERVASLFSNERPVAAVLIFDTSASMEYSAAGRTRLEEAKQRASELLDEMDPASQVALLDSADDAGEGGPEWLSPALAQARLDGLRIHPANAAVNRQLDRAVRMLEKVGEGEDPTPRFLYVFSDRARASWDPRAGPRTMPDGIRALFVDVGADKPKDLAIEKLEVVPPVVAPGSRIQIQATVRATGADFDTELLCQLDNDPDSERKMAIQLAAGQGRVFVFERDAPQNRGENAETIYQVTVKHQTADALPFNNTSFATFLTRQRRKVLSIVADKPLDRRDAGPTAPLPWKAWQTATHVVDLFQCDIRPLAEADKLADKELHGYAAVCVFQIVPSAGLWQKLDRYVRGGGGLVLVPGGEEMRRQLPQYNEEGTKAGLLPGMLQKIETNPANRPLIRWSNFRVKHPIPAFFDKAMRTAEPDFSKPQSWPGVNAFWSVTPTDKDTLVLATYADRGRHPPALLERTVERGHVLLFTTPLDTRDLDRNRPWHNYWSDSSFGLILEDQVLRYLAGDSTMPELNYFCGQIPRVPLPSSLAAPLYMLDGPGLAVAETNIKANEGDTQLSLPQAVTAGNYAVRDADQRIVAGCSLNVRPQESELERVPAEEIESVLGKDTLLQVGRTISLKDALTGMHPPPLELLPWLMMAVLIVLTVESLLANRFYRRAASAAETGAISGEAGA